ncbi:hypothetical protein OSB04_027429, partial [Centaurea solstitialis]
MASSSSSRKPEIKGRGLIDEVFSWSVRDVLNVNLYKDKPNKLTILLVKQIHQQVKRIPQTFSSATDYTKSFVEPLLEETHAELLSNVKNISRASTRGITGGSTAKYFEFPKDLFYNLLLEKKSGSENKKGFYEPEVGDLIALTNRIPTCVDDLSRPNASAYVIALVQRVNDEVPHKIQVICSKPYAFPDKESKRGGEFILFAMKIIDKVLNGDSKGSKRCSLCSAEDAQNSASPNLQEAISTLNLNPSQKTAIWSCIAARECQHQETVNLIWGPPGTGKTKMISALLFALWKMKCRTLTCTPTNNAVVEVAARVCGLVKSSLEYDTYGFGDIVLFGNGERMKIGGFQELNQVFLENRVSVLADCLSPTFGWRRKAESMIRILKYPKDEYSSVGNGKTIDSKEKVPKNTKSKDKKLSFSEFVTERFNVLEEKLTTMVRNLYTHMPTSFVTLQLAKKMMKVISLIRSIGVSITGNDGMRNELLQVLEEVLCQTVSFPKSTDDWEIGNFCLKTASLIFCTASSSIRLHNIVTKVELLVVDEAAQLRECESFIPLQLAGLRGVVLIGDEKQLPATVKSEICKKLEFGRSLFERLVSLKHTTHLLNIQYRMHPTISSFPNKEFYGGKIIDGPNVIKGSYKKQFLEGDMFGSYSFIHLTQGKVEFDDTGSGKNMVEVAVIIELLARLGKECVAKNRKISVGCIAPYKAQVDAIQSKLQSVYGRRECKLSVNVRTVDGFQGCEEDVIIISTVTGIGKKSIGFLSKPQRANVALTRARHCLWIVGNGDVLRHSSPIWKRLVKHAKNAHCFHVGNNDKTLDQAITNTLVVFDDGFLKSMINLKKPESCKEVHSLLMKLSGGLRVPQTGDVSHDSILFNMYAVNCSGFKLVWSVVMMEEGVESVQVLKVWDIFEGSLKQSQLIKRVNKFYRGCSEETRSRCKEKLQDRDLEVPKSWSKVDNISKGIASMSLTKEAGSSSSHFRDGKSGESDRPRP